MPADRPSVVVLAGPNGAGKSTLAGQLVPDILGVSEFVDADVLARALPPSRAAPITAGRAMLKHLDELATRRQSFGFETTLASRSFAPRIRRLLRDGYESHLVFLWLPAADLAVARVADRVRLGGHAVPEATIRRRYLAGLRNFFELYQPLTTTWRMYDNSTYAPRLIASGAGRETLKPRARIGRIFADGRQIDAALRSAVRQAIRDHEKHNAPLAVWRDGRTVLVPPRTSRRGR